jgi:hypothetical protein
MRAPGRPAIVRPRRQHPKDAKEITVSTEERIPAAADAPVHPADYLYQIYGNASKLVGYGVQPDGSLTGC